MTTEEAKAAIQSLSKQEIKDIVKVAIKEWLDDQTLTFGRWTIRVLAVAALGSFLYLILTSQGWKHS